MTGSIPKIPFALPHIPARPAFTVPGAEGRMLDFEDIELWIQPDLGNVRTGAGNYLSITGRKGWRAQSNDAKIALGTGMANAIPTINMAAGVTTLGKLPLHVPGYIISGSYFVAVLFRWASTAVFDATVYRFMSAGITGGADVEFYSTSNRLVLRHTDALSQTAVLTMAANTSYLVWASYDAALNQAKVGINSASATAWSTNALTGAGGAGREIVIGSVLNAEKTQGSQPLLGEVRGFWAGRTPWVAPETDTVREAFLREIASLYPDDITLS
ncbi:hypothetical protein [Mesorhizobium sp. J428]|uniref:hypothetical protein n=1 Tax=Mesorhizobium sp. J428 TaxID=2898440 RepID=UPI0021513569|nr:hypothetical protein [Mesorhizobium sp. J428]MCR5856003.1 hypothetical protein [Mesorhizobium sp. J428]